MKNKLFIFIIISIFILNGCTISYSTSVEKSPQINTDSPSTPEEPIEPEEDNSNDNEEETITDDWILEDTSATIPSITIENDTYFYPLTLDKISPIIATYSSETLGGATTYTVYSAYYSQSYDTLYIAYDSLQNPTQTLMAKDLFELEKHALNYFIKHENKDDYTNYLKVINIFPDNNFNACGNSQSVGCATHIGKEASITLNYLANLHDFYSSTALGDPRRYTFAHEFGHISTFYNMAYKNDEDYEDYLKIRLGDKYDTIYPSGLPSTYSSSDDSYYINPYEILADDFVDLFYDTSSKLPTDTYSYTLNHNDSRNSLNKYPDIQYLEKGTILYDTIKSYYTSNFLSYKNKTQYDKPIIVSSPSNKIYYYPSYSQIGNYANQKVITSTIDINLLAVGEVIVNKTKYYRVILSNTFNIVSSNYTDSKNVGKMMGYIKASNYSTGSNMKIYKIDNDNNSKMAKNSMAPINGYPKIYFLPYYDFSYIIEISTSSGLTTTYDYLNSKISSQTYKISTYSFGTLIS